MVFSWETNYAHSNCNQSFISGSREINMPLIILTYLHDGLSLFENLICIQIAEKMLRVFVGTDVYFWFHNNPPLYNEFVEIICNKFNTVKCSLHRAQEKSINMCCLSLTRF
jgi:hypothetical protein